jgi:hypothetical protein
VFYYILLLLFLLATVFIKKYSLVYYYLSLLMLLLLAGFRYNVGTDYWRYEEAYVGGEAWFPEVGLKLIIYLLKSVNIDVQIYFFVLALFIQLLFLKGFKNFSVNQNTFNYKEVLYYLIFFYVTLYYFNHSMNLIRQFIAMGLFLINIKYIVNKKFLKYNIIFFLMFIFHQTSLFLYPLYFLKGILYKIFNHSKKTVILLILSFLLMFVKFDKVIIDLIMMFGGRYSYYAIWASDKYLKYELSPEVMVLLFVKLMLTVWMVINRRKFINNRYSRVVYGIFIVGALLTYPLYPMLIFRRLLFYINITEIFIFTLFALKDREARIILIIYSISLFFVNLIYGFSNPLPVNFRLPFL